MSKFWCHSHAKALYIDPMEQNRLPDKLICARYRHLSERINALPQITTGEEIIRVKMPSTYGTYKYRKVFPNSPKRAHYEQLLALSLNLKTERDQLIAQWNANHDVPIATAAAGISIVDRNDGILTIQNYNSWAEYSNSHPITTEYTSDGKMYRSRIELMTAETLKDLGLEWKYEPLISLNAPSRFAGDNTTVEFTPDFAVAVRELGRVFLIECLGMLSESSYANDAFDKLKIYSYNGVYPGRDLTLISGDKNYMPSMEAIAQSVRSTLGILCAESIRSSNEGAPPQSKESALTSAGSLTS